MLIVSYDTAEISKVKGLLRSQYKMTDLGLARRLLGIDIKQSQGGVRLDQRHFIDSILRRFGMESCNGTKTPLEARPELEFDPLSPEDQRLYQSLVGNIMYTMLGTRPDLAYTISALSKFSSSAGKSHQLQAKRVLRYLRGTSEISLSYVASDRGTDLLGYTDSDWAGDRGDRKSTSGFVFLFCGGAISWKSKKQTIVALSTTEAEYIAASEASREAIWLQRLFDELAPIAQLPPRTAPTLIFADSTGCLAQIDNARHHERTKHVDIKYHFVRDTCERALIRFEHCSTSDMAADVLTKPLTRDLHWRHLQKISLQVRK
jgi:hypothetical protein